MADAADAESPGGLEPAEFVTDDGAIVFVGGDAPGLEDGDAPILEDRGVIVAFCGSGLGKELYVSAISSAMFIPLATVL